MLIFFYMANFSSKEFQFQLERLYFKQTYTYPPSDNYIPLYHTHIYGKEVSMILIYKSLYTQTFYYQQTYCSIENKRQLPFVHTNPNHHAKDINNLLPFKICKNKCQIKENIFNIVHLKQCKVYIIISHTYCTKLAHFKRPLFSALLNKTTTMRTPSHTQKQIQST